MLPTPRRIESDELLDEHDAPYDDMARSLRDLRRINRWAGGFRVYRSLIRRVVPDSDRPLQMLDVGTGTSDLFDALTHRKLTAFGLDFKIEHLLYGRRFNENVHRVAGDATALPYSSSSFDLVTSAHFFHHFSPDQNVGILNEALRVARLAVIVN